jgi:signal peptidase complex subunit 1
MADQILEQIRDATEGQIDFEGQRFAEFLATGLLATVGVSINSQARLPPSSDLVQGIAFIVGYFLQDIKRALLIGLGGAVLTFLLVVPPWPFFNRHPVKWLPVGGREETTRGIIVDGKVIG